jgi:hypothetical protein
MNKGDMYDKLFEITKTLNIIQQCDLKTILNYFCLEIITTAKIRALIDRVSIKEVFTETNGEYLNRKNRMNQTLSTLKLKLIEEEEYYEYFFETESNSSSETNTSLNDDAKRSIKRRKYE